ncbi:MAG: hypothetical protein ACPH5G_08920 [Pseudooceanicola atlanticus]
MLMSLKLGMRRAGFGLGGLLLMAIGAGFLTVAAWIALAEAHDAQYAALIIGSVYFGLGALVVAFGTRRPIHHVPPTTAAAMTTGGLGAAFAQGFGAGAAARQAMKSSH